MRLSGWLGHPSDARSQADLQYVYVNGRIVKDKTISHALRMAYDGILHGHQYSAYLLFLEVDPDQVDVNVHPTKHEIRFLNQREVHEFVRHHAKETLAQFQTASADLAQAMKSNEPKDILRDQPKHQEQFSLHRTDATENPVVNRAEDTQIEYRKELSTDLLTEFNASRPKTVEYSTRMPVRDPG